MDFRSDNVAGAHPLILEALARENRGSASAYGEDSVTRRLGAKLSELFEHELTFCMVSTGTAANALSLSLLTPAWGAIYCHPEAHIQIAECGAPELFSAGAKLVSVATGPKARPGRLSADEVERVVTAGRSPRASLPSALSLSQASELGTVYQLAELAELGRVARTAGLGVHLDGARFANALVALGASPAELTWKAGVDAVSFGASKNGALCAELVVVFDVSRADELRFRQRRAGQQLSKARFLAAQLEAYLEHELWLDNARHANAQATRLAQGLVAEQVVLCAAVETNQVFCEIEEPRAALLRARGFQFHDWPALGQSARRFVTSFDTRAEDIDTLLHVLRSSSRVLRAPNG